MMNICIFGDSITWGANDNKHGGWANMLRNDLAPNEKVYNCGVPGDNTKRLLDRFEVEAKARKADVIIIAIGINDSQYIDSRENTRVPKDQFTDNLEQLITQARSITEKILFIGLTSVDESKVTPVPIGDKNINYDNTNIDLYNSLIKDVCDKNNIPFLEVQDLLNLSDLDDGLHPNTEGHQKMFQEVKEFVKTELSLGEENN